MPEVRIAGVDDIPALLDLHAAYCAADRHEFDHARVTAALQELIAQPSLGCVLVLEVGNQAHGYGVLACGFSLECGGVEYVLDELFVEPQGAGYGSVLLEACIAEAKRRGARRLFLETEADNVAARRFYGRHGFHVEDSIWMAQFL